MALYDYRCRLGHTTERLASRDTELTDCAMCGAPADRVPFNRVAIVVNDTMSFGAMTVHTQNGRLDVESPETRHKFRRYREATQEIDHAYSQVEASVGHPVRGPNLWQAAKRGANEIAAAGEAPVPANNG